MIVLPRHQTLLFTPFRVASATLHEVLARPEYGGVAVFGPAGDNGSPHYNQHTTWIDPAHRDWKRVVVVRNELDRLVSMFEFYREGGGRADWPRFVLAAWDGRPEHHWHWHWTIERWARPLKPYQALQFENLQVELSQLLGQHVKLDIHHHKSDRRPLADYYSDPEVKRLAEEWASGVRTLPNRIELARRLFKPHGVGLELGTFRGEFAKVLLGACQPRVLYLCDHWLHSLYWGEPTSQPGEPLRQNLIPADQAYRDCLELLWPDIVSGRVRILHGPSKEWIPRLPARHLDWVYLDADHSYEGTLADLELVRDRVVDGGWIAGHDWCELFPGVEKAVREFCSARGFRLEWLTREGQVDGPAGPVSYNSFAVRAAS